MDANVLNNTIINIDKLLMIRQCAENIRRQNLIGASAELGVYRGGVSKLIANELPSSVHYVFDTFDGLKDCQAGLDTHANGDFSDVNYTNVEMLLNNSNIVFRAGYFPDTVQDMQDTQYVLVHLDVDTYKSTLAGLAYFYPRLVPGGIMAIDDYTFHTCPGVEKACNEYFSDKPDQPTMLVNGQALITKSPSQTKFFPVWFDHGLGDCAHFTQILQLYRRRNYLVAVHFEHNKQDIWRSAGFPFAELHGSPYHPFIYDADFNRPNAEADHSGNKTAANLLLSPLPPLDEPIDALWDELARVDERKRIRAHLGTQYFEAVDRWLAGLPGPIILLHPQGTNWAEQKNLPIETVQKLYRLLLENSDASLVLLDWDCRVPEPPASCRVRHVKRDFGHISTGEMLTLMQRADLLIGVDSGPMHSALFTDIPVLGVLHHLYPSCITLPNPRAAFMTRNSPSYKPINQSRRGRWSILEYSGQLPTADEIAHHALRMLQGPRYLTKDRIGRDVLLQQLVRDWLRCAPPGVAYADRDRTFDWLFKEMTARFPAANVVETGCQRSNEDWTAGCSTYLFGCYLDGISAGRLNSVDISAHNLATAAQCCQSWNNCITYNVCDSVKWLEDYRQQIDVLYLDSLDADHAETAAHGLKEFQAALPKLHERSIVVIDDTVWRGDYTAPQSGSYSGKAAAIMPVALATGWRVALCGYQVVLIRSPQEQT
jgi:O-methyltransferase